MNSERGAGALRADMSVDPRSLARSLEEFIRGCVARLKRDGAILGLSGGLDSAVVAALCARAVGADKTVALVMPERDSERQNTRDALEFAGERGITARLIDLTPHLRRLGVYRLFFLHRFPLPTRVKSALARKAHAYFVRRRGCTPFSAALLALPDGDLGLYLRRSSAYYRVKHRLRMALLYLHADRGNLLAVGAANRTELSIGFFVKHGIDQAADIMPLAKLYKTQVRELARYLGIPERIMAKPPSPDIVPGITDEEAIGIPYEKLDLILLALSKGWKTPDVAAAVGVADETVTHVGKLVADSEHMRTVFCG